MKKLLTLLLVVCFATLCGCGYLPQTTTITSTTAEKQPDKPDETLISTVPSYVGEPETTDVTTIESSAETTANEKKQVEIIKEYTCSDGFWYTYHFVIVKNVGDVPVSINTDTIAYDSDEKMISVASGSLDILEPNCISIYYEAFETKEKISRYVTTRTLEVPKYYQYGVKNLSYDITDIKNGKIIQVTNNGTEPIDFVQGYLLYFKNGNIVGWRMRYITDDESEIKPGKTISCQYSIYDDYDTIEFYLTGRR